MTYPQDRLRTTQALPAAGLLLRALFAFLVAFQLTYVRIHLLAEVHHHGSSASHDSLTGTLSDHHCWTADENEHRPHHALEHQITLLGRPRPVWLTPLASPALLAASGPELPLPQTAVQRETVAQQLSPPDRFLIPQGARAPPLG